MYTYGMTKLTQHFTLDEFTVSETAARKGYPNVPAPHTNERNHLTRLAETMELVRDMLGGKPILVTSGYRSPKVNAAVGGSKTSKHMEGLACDFICPGYGTPLLICKAIEPHVRELGIDQLIHEFATWVHLGLRDGEPRHQVLTIDTKGTRNGLS
jgi:hypothetical protein